MNGEDNDVRLCLIGTILRIVIRWHRKEWKKELLATAMKKEGSSKSRGLEHTGLSSVGQVRKIGLHVLGHYILCMVDMAILTNPYKQQPN
jgi:hypothetical protein